MRLVAAMACRFVPRAEDLVNASKAKKDRRAAERQAASSELRAASSAAGAEGGEHAAESSEQLRTERGEQPSECSEQMVGQRSGLGGQSSFAGHSSHRVVLDKGRWLCTRCGATTAADKPRMRKLGK
eukprot:3670533-Karenia_brevis.AAC.1